MATPARDRYPTDSELRRIKVAAHYGKDGKPTVMGPTIACLIDLAYLTGQGIGDLLDLRWNKRAALGPDGQMDAPYIAAEGIFFKPSKTANSTGAKVLIEWTPRLRAVIKRIEAIGWRNVRWVITSQEAQRYEYEAFKSAWARAIERSGVKALHFQKMGAHSTEAQTADYVRRRKAQKTEATR